MFVTDREPLINRSILILPLNLLNWDPTSPLSSSISSISVHVHQLSIWWCPTHYWCLEPHISPQSPTAPTPGKGETELNWRQTASCPQQVVLFNNKSILAGVFSRGYPWHFDYLHLGDRWPGNIFLHRTNPHCDLQTCCHLQVEGKFCFPACDPVSERGSLIDPAHL